MSAACETVVCPIHGDAVICGYKPPLGNTAPTVQSVLGKLRRVGSLFALDEVRVLTHEIDKLRAERDQAVAAMREIQRRYVRTDKA